MAQKADSHQPTANSHIKTLKDSRQRQANHFAEMVANAQAVLDNPDTTPEDKAEATQDKLDMQSNLNRLAQKYGVVPGGA